MSWVTNNKAGQLGFNQNLSELKANQSITQYVTRSSWHKWIPGWIHYVEIMDIKGVPWAGDPDHLKGRTMDKPFTENSLTHLE